MAMTTNNSTSVKPRLAMTQDEEEGDGETDGLDMRSLQRKKEKEMRRKRGIAIRKCYELSAVYPPCPNKSIFYLLKFGPGWWRLRTREGMENPDGESLRTRGASHQAVASLQEILGLAAK
jgi:hypothetical protein